jgi:hypothetical protein
LPIACGNSPDSSTSASSPETLYSCRLLWDLPDPWWERYWRSYWSLQASFGDLWRPLVQTSLCPWKLEPKWLR